MLNQNVQNCVDTLCKNGCSAVRATIEAIELGLTPQCTAMLSEQETAQVLAELRSIMAVYDEREQAVSHEA